MYAFVYIWSKLLTWCCIDGYSVLCIL